VKDTLRGYCWRRLRRKIRIVDHDLSRAVRSNVASLQRHSKTNRSRHLVPVHPDAARRNLESRRAL
jgi:hypothetical protein